jgi:hypothetical protein
VGSLSARGWLLRSPSNLQHRMAGAAAARGDPMRSLGDSKGSLGDAKGSLGDAKGSLGDAKGSLGDAYMHGAGTPGRIASRRTLAPLDDCGATGEGAAHREPVWFQMVQKELKAEGCNQELKGLLNWELKRCSC